MYTYLCGWLLYGISESIHNQFTVGTCLSLKYKVNCVLYHVIISPTKNPWLPFKGYGMIILNEFVICFNNLSTSSALRYLNMYYAYHWMKYFCCRNLMKSRRFLFNMSFLTNKIHPLSIESHFTRPFLKKTCQFFNDTVCIYTV